MGEARFEPLTRIAKLIKVDMRTTAKPEQERLLRTYQPRGIAMVAEKVETHEEFEWAKSAGYDYFQGYFFARPMPKAEFVSMLQQRVGRKMAS